MQAFSSNTSFYPIPHAVSVKPPYDTTEFDCIVYDHIKTRFGEPPLGRDRPKPRYMEPMK